MKISGNHAAGAVAPVALERPATEAAGVSKADADDKVSLSSTARSREAASAHPRFGPLSVRLHGDPELAEQLAYDYAHTVHTPLYDISGMDAGGPMRYSATGEPVTPESEARYKQEGESLHAASLALYAREMGKGTQPGDIFDKLIALGDSQSAEFRTVTKWEATAADWD